MKERAGIIPYYIKNDEIYMMFMIPSDPAYGGTKPQIAKGGIDEGEDALNTAIREGYEELGLFKGNIEDINYIGKFIKNINVFVAKIKDPEMFGDPGYETKQVMWLTPEEFNSIGRTTHKPIIMAAERHIKNIENIE